MRSVKRLVAWVSTAIHSLSFRMLLLVVWPMKVGGPQWRLPLLSKVPLLTATVLGAWVRSKPRPAKYTFPCVSKAMAGSPHASYCPPVRCSVPAMSVARWLDAVTVERAGEDEGRRYRCDGRGW